MGIKTHFLEYLPPSGMLCKKVDIIQPARITRQSKNYLIPLEFICRWYVAGSLYDRVKDGKVLPRIWAFLRAITSSTASSCLSPSWRSPPSWRRPTGC